MKTCFYCGKEFDLYDEPIQGFDNGVAVIACEDCENEQNEFYRAVYFEDDVYKRFNIQHRSVDDPVEIWSEFYVCKDLSEAIEYAQEKYNEDELMGIEFDEYANVHGKELTYNSKTGYFEVFMV